MSVTAFAILLLSASDPATATATPQPAPVVERKICKTFERTGSRMRPTRICKTESEWRYEQQIAQQKVEEQQRTQTRN